MVNLDSNLDDVMASEKALAEALVHQCQLPTEAQQEIFATMRREGIGFADAALLLGLVTRNDIDTARAESARQTNDDGPSLIVTAIKKVSRFRSPSVTEGKTLQPSKSLILAHDPDHARSEQMRALRTELVLLDAMEARSKGVAMVSPGSGEGRSQLAAELAIAYSQLGRRTLLVDADLRNPSQHVLFNSDNHYGLSQAVASLDPVILNPVAQLPYLAVLTSGPLPANPLELLSDGRLIRLMDTLSETYDFIIMDTPPISKFADGLAVATIAGRVLVASRAMHTTFDEMRSLMRRLVATRAQVMGAVLGHF